MRLEALYGRAKCTHCEIGDYLARVPASPAFGCLGAVSPVGTLVLFASIPY